MTNQANGREAVVRGGANEVRQSWLAVFAKAPVAGRVKTRLCPPFSPALAASFYRAMLADVLATSAHAANQFGMELVVAVDPPESVAGLAPGGPQGARFIAQRGTHLAERMSDLARSAAAAGVSTLLMRGSDSPALPEALIQGALEVLGAGTDLAVSPDPDGGYNLLGLSRRALETGFSTTTDLFDHPMSTDTVLEQSLARARAAGLRATLLAESFDIDRAGDLERLRAFRDGAVCPNTLKFLDSHALWTGADLPTPRALAD